MQLGSLLSYLESEENGGEALQALDDLPLFVRIGAMAATHDETPGEYVANASRRFAARAGDADWLAIMTAVEKADDPGRAVLHKMLVWALDGDARAAADPAGCATGGCGCGGGGQGRNAPS
jgi:hypothetical protein